MSHEHFCHVAGHYWQCEGKALRGGGTDPTVCICSPCGRPLEGFDHSGCPDPVELVACPEHIEEERRSIEEFRQRHGGSAAKPEEADAIPAGAEQGESPAERSPEEAARPFERFPLVPIEPEDPLWHCEWCCHCGCRRMPRELSGGVCFHCGHVYQRNDPEFWLAEEFPHSEAAHLKGCANYQGSSKKSEAQWARFRAMTPEGTDEETFSKLLSACYSKAIDDNYEAYVSAPEGSAERAAIVEKIVSANAEEIAERRRQLDAQLEKRRSE
jgi:hypothetical protein